MEYSENGTLRLTYGWAIGSAFVKDNKKVKKIMGCRKSFCIAYNCTEYYVRSICDDIRNDFFDSKNSGASHESKVSWKTICLINAVQATFGKDELTEEQMRNMSEAGGMKTLAVRVRGSSRVIIL